MRQRLRLLPGLLLLVLLLVPAPRAEAHAVLLGSSPINGERLSRAPLLVVLRFNEPVEAEFTPLVVRDRTGARVDRGDPQLSPDHTALSIGLTSLGTGFYTATYHITSVDGHPVQGALAFTIGDATPGTVTTTGPVSAASDPGVVPVGPGLLHGLVAAVAVVLAGLTAFVVWVWWPAAPPQSHALRRRLPWALALLLALLALAELAVFAVRASGEPFSPALLGQALLHSRSGNLWFWRAGLAGLSALALSTVMAGPQLRLPVRSLAPLPGAFLLLTLTWQSHAMATRELLPVLADWGHLVALAPWVGGLIGFLTIARPALAGLAAPEREDLLARVVPRFSRVAVGAVAVLVLTGIYGATVHIHSLAELTETAYGWTLIAKVVLLLPVMALASLNLVKRGRGPFLRMVMGELILVAVIFGAAGLLSSMAPAPVQIAIKQMNYTADATQDGVQMHLHINPARVGSVQAEIRLAAAGAPLTGAGTGVRVAMLDHDMGLQNLDAKETAPGTYLTEPIVLGMEGPWKIEVVLLTKDGREIRHTFPLTVAP